MNWHFLQGLEEASWEGNSLDGAPSALSKLMPIADESSSNGNATASSPDSRYGMTLKRLTGQNGEAELTWYRGDSPVRTYHPPAGERESEDQNQGCGPKWPGSLVRYNPNSYSWKTRQISFFAGLETFLGTWPPWGMMRDGECWERMTPALPIAEKGFGFWPTPMASDYRFFNSRYYISPNYSSLGKTFREQLNRSPSIPFWEGLMGWPIGWTGLKPLEMDRFRQWLNSHGKY